jgi:hypothetical protein
MSGLRSDMSRIDRIYLAWGSDMSGHEKHCAAEK